MTTKLILEIAAFALTDYALIVWILGTRKEIKALTEQLHRLEGRLNILQSRVEELEFLIQA